MPQIHIRKSHKLDPAHARAMAERIATELAAEYRLRYQWRDDELTFHSGGIDGRLHVGEEEVNIRVNLALLMQPLRGRIERTIRSRLESILA